MLHRERQNLMVVCLIKYALVNENAGPSMDRSRLAARKTVCLNVTRKRTGDLGTLLQRGYRT